MGERKPQLVVPDLRTDRRTVVAGTAAPGCLPPIRRNAFRRPPRTHSVPPQPRRPWHCLPPRGERRRSLTRCAAVGATGLVDPPRGRWRRSLTGRADALPPATRRGPRCRPRV